MSVTFVFYLYLFIYFYGSFDIFSVSFFLFSFERGEGSPVAWLISRTFSANEQYFSLTINQPTVLSAIAYQPNEQVAG